MVLLSTAIIGLLVIVGVALLAIGLRGRRTDDHPLCRRCGYDLTAGDTAGRCPECGADLSRRRTLQIGHRSRRPVLIVVGTVLQAPCLLIAGVGIWVHSRGIDPTPYKPVWWLRADLDSSPTRRAKALGELTTRVANGSLTPAQADAIADRALRAQASDAPWDPLWGGWIEAAQAAGAWTGPAGPATPGRPYACRSSHSNIIRKLISTSPANTSCRRRN